MRVARDVLDDRGRLELARVGSSTVLVGVDIIEFDDLERNVTAEALGVFAAA